MNELSAAYSALVLLLMILCTAGGFVAGRMHGQAFTYRLARIGADLDRWYAQDHLVRKFAHADGVGEEKDGAL